MSLDFINAGKPYMDQKSFLEDWKALLDWRIYLVYQNHAWLGPENRLQNMMGLVVSREEFEYNLARGAQEQAFQGLSDARSRGGQRAGGKPHRLYRRRAAGPRSGTDAGTEPV